MGCGAIFASIDLTLSMLTCVICCSLTLLGRTLLDFKMHCTHILLMLGMRLVFLF